MHRPHCLPIPSPESPVASSGGGVEFMLANTTGQGFTPRIGYLELPVAHGLVYAHFPQVKTGVMQRSHPDTWASLQGDRECTAPNKREGLEQQLMTMTASEADAHRIEFKVPTVNWAHTHSKSGQERDWKQRYSEVC